MKMRKQAATFSTLKPDILMITSHLASNHSLSAIKLRIYEIVELNYGHTRNTGFWFKQEYFGNLPPKGTNTRDHLLHKSLKEQMEKVHNERTAIVEDLAKATLYCKYALRSATNLSEYLSLLPEQFGSEVREYIRSNTGLVCEFPPYPEAFISLFKTKYAQEEQGLKNQLVYNLLQG